MTVQMRLVLRPGADKGLWRHDGLLIRDTARFALEFARLDDAPEGGGAAAARFWSVVRPCPRWYDLLSKKVAAGELHPRVLAGKEQHDAGVILYDLIVQLDHEAGFRHARVGVPQHRIQVRKRVHRRGGSQAVEPQAVTVRPGDFTMPRNPSHPVALVALLLAWGTPSPGRLRAEPPSPDWQEFFRQPEGRL